MGKLYIIVVLTLSFLSFPAYAATITVDTLEDNANIYPGPVQGCTLRDAITSANTDQKSRYCAPGNGADEIVFASRLTGAISLVSPLPTVTQDLRIVGPRSAATSISINGGGQTRLIEVAGVAFHISNLTLVGGGAQGSPSNPLGSSTGEGGAIKVLAGTGNLEFVRIRFRDNFAEHTGGAVWIQTVGNIVFEECEFTNNRVLAIAANTGGGAIFIDPLAVQNAQTITISRSTFERNMATRPAPDPAPLTVEPSGGAILVQTAQVPVQRTFKMTINTSTFWKNEAARNGGAIALVRASTQSTNNAGIDINNTTISFNIADRNRDGFGGGGGISSGYPVDFRNSVVARNTASSGNFEPDIDATIQSGGFNFFGVAPTSGGLASSDISGSLNAPADPWADNVAIADNGGFTKTVEPHVSLRGASPLVDAGLCSNTDQRGQRRPVDIPSVLQAGGSNACDIGAVENAGS